MEKHGEITDETPGEKSAAVAGAAGDKTATPGARAADAVAKAADSEKKKKTGTGAK